MKEKTDRLAGLYLSGAENLRKQLAQFGTRSGGSKSVVMPPIQQLPKLRAGDPPDDRRFFAIDPARQGVWFDESHHLDSAQYFIQSAMSSGTVVEDPIAKFKDHELVMAMIKRGYAVMKLPEGGGIPEVLKK